MESESDSCSKMGLLQITVAVSSGFSLKTKNPLSHFHQTLSTSAAGSGIILLFWEDIYCRARPNALSQTDRAGGS